MNKGQIIEMLTRLTHNILQAKILLKANEFDRVILPMQNSIETSRYLLKHVRALVKKSKKPKPFMDGLKKVKRRATTKVKAKKKPTRTKKTVKKGKPKIKTTRTKK